jgi:hypothetical protein
MMPGTGADLVLWSAARSPALEGWRTTAAPGSRSGLAVEQDPAGGVLRFDFELVGPTAWAIARREIDARLPAHYVAVLRVRGAGPSHDLQLKLVDPTGTSVWWWRRRDAVLGDQPMQFVLPRAALELAWGPGAAEPDRIGAVEIAVAGGQEGAGTLWIEELRIEAREEPGDPLRPTRVRASSAVPGHEPERVLDADDESSWQPASGDPQPWLECDLGRRRDWGGLLIELPGATAVPPRLLVSDDGARWTAVVEESAGDGRRRWLRTGAVEFRFARLEVAPHTRVARVEFVPVELAVAPARWAASVARRETRGCFPRHLLGEQAVWALVGGDGDERKGLLGEDGALEVDFEGFTLEPFLWTDGRLHTWADVERRMGLVDGCLPIPWVEWTAGRLRLRITAFATGAPGRSALVARYELANEGRAARDVRLLVAIRPFQVTPAWQSLNLKGAICPITSMEGGRASVLVNETRAVVAVTAADGFGAAPSGDGLRAAFAGGLPPHVRIDDPLGFAEGALGFDLRLPAGAKEAVVVAAPLFAATAPPPAGLAPDAAAAWGAARLEEARMQWSTRLARVPVALPPGADTFEHALRASLAWILVSREGPRIQPGARAYRRSWMRDGAFTATTLAEMGFAHEARTFLRWYALHQHADGRVPCAVDRRGVDPTVEHDSHGQLAWAVVEVFRLTGDRGFLNDLWPHVRSAAQAIVALRAERTTDAFRDRACFGLLPESISHEGYASSPVHAYWDDLFALAGLTAAAEAAAVVDDAETAAQLAHARDDMRRDVHASIVRTQGRHGIDFLPGSVELGDFDPTSSAIAFDPCADGARIPRPVLEATFERYWREFEARRSGAATADVWTPYEVRNATAFLALGWKARALAVLEWVMAGQWPTTWRQWPEIVHRDRRAPRFLGDLPHGWVAASFVRALRRLLVEERSEDGTLVIGAGVPEAWVREAPGVRLRALPTRFGTLDLTMCAPRDDRVDVTLGGSARPPGGIVLASPLGRPLREAVVDGSVHRAESDQRVSLGGAPAAITLCY